MKSTCDISYWWCLDDSDSLNNLFLVHLRTRSVEIADDGGHASLVAHGGGKVDWFLWVILRKAANVSASTLMAVTSR
jgi:hypothetical protein